MPTEFDDDYPTCSKTYASLRLDHEDLDPERITGLLKIEPTWTQTKGVRCTRRSGKTFVPKIGVWLFSTKDRVASKDVRRHVDWLLTQLDGKDEALKRLQAEGVHTDIFCYWLSADGQGGPTLSPGIMRRLAELELEIGFDIYGPYDD